jgi:phosphatidylglycerol---prolipoprotein diacylglyceryl transferase
MINWFQYTNIGPIQVWGLFVALGMILTLVIIWKRAKRFNLDYNKVIDQAMWMIISGIIFSRFFHIVFYELNIYLNNPTAVFKIWQGGLSSFGGVFGAVLGFFIYAKRKSFNKNKIIKIADLISFSAVYGWMVGRIGCFMIHDHIGMKSSAWFAIQTPDGPRLEMALLEIVGLIPLAILFFVFRNKKLKNLWFLNILFIYYGILRFILDFFRATDISHADVRYFSLTPGQYFAIILVVVGGLLYYKRRNGEFA